MERVRRNPFYVLGLRPGCGRAAIEHQGARVLQMLDLDLVEVKRYGTPLGEEERTADAVREALHELRDPERRARHEPWAALPPEPLPEPPPGRRAPWPDALEALGW